MAHATRGLVVLLMMVPVALLTLVQAVPAIQTLVALSMMAPVVPHTMAREALGTLALEGKLTMVPVVLRMMVLEGHVIQDQATHAIRVQGAKALTVLVLAGRDWARAQCPRNNNTSNAKFGLHTQEGVSCNRVLCLSGL